MCNRLWFCVVGSLFLLLHASSGWASSSSPQLAASLVSIKSLYQQQQWSQVISQAQQAIQSPRAEAFAVQYAQLHVFLGAALFQQKYKSLASSAFERALLWYPQATLPPDASESMQKLFASAQKESQTSALSAPKQSGSETPRPVTDASRVHIGWILGWVSVAITGAALGLAAVAGGNAYINAQESSNLLKEARRKGYSQLSTDPFVTHVHASAATYGTVANVSFAVAAVTALSATGFFLWAALGTPRVAKTTGRTAILSSSNQTHRNTVLLVP